MHCKPWKRFTVDGIDILLDRISIVEAIKMIKDTGKSPTYFKVKSQDISKLGNGSFIDLPRLKNLYLECCKTGHFEVVAFSGLFRLKPLSIQKNEIKHLQRHHFVDLRELIDYLKLANNNIVKTDRGTFRNLRNLKRLDIALNS